MKKAWLALGLAFPFVLGFAASYFFPGGFALGQANGQKAGGVWSILLLAAVMIIGIFSSFVFEKSRQAKNDKQPLSLKLSEIFGDFRFIAALFVSPLIFNSIYALTNQNPETLGDFLLAYQNGFFWQTVLAGVTSGFAKAASPKRAAAAKK